MPNGTEFSFRQGLHHFVDSERKGDTLHMRTRLSALIAVMLAVASLAAAQGTTTGTLSGKVADSSGGVLPGVTVTLSGPSLQGVRTRSPTIRGTTDSATFRPVRITRERPRCPGSGMRPSQRFACSSARKAR